MQVRNWCHGVLIVLLLAGCSTIPPVTDPEAIGHMLSVGRDGELDQIKVDEVIYTDMGEGFAPKSPGDFDRIIDGIRTFPRNSKGEIEVLIYVHGGLNTKKHAIGRVLKKYRMIMDDPNEPRYPIFINWKSGPWSTYWEHLWRFRQGEISKVAHVTFPVYFLTDFAQSVVNAPKSWGVSGEHSVKSVYFRDDDYLDTYKESANGVYFTGNKNGYGNFGRSAIWLATSPFKVLTTPYTYTMARPAWDVMLRRTNTPFFTPSDLENGDHHFEVGSKEGSGALYRFLLKLEQVIRDEKLPVKITLVGHSMGAIVVNRIIDLDLDLPIENIVHMASADSISHLFSYMVPYIATHDVNFYNLSLHPENEDREVSAKGFTPSGSLPVWIDDMFSSPETVLDKRSGRWSNMERALPLIPTEAKARMHFKIFGINKNGCENEQSTAFCEPQEHGQFGDLPFWKQQAWWK